MAALQPTERSQFGYKRAAKAVIGLPVSVADLVAAGTLREVVDAGCLFALDSDAHSIGELRFTDYAIAHARLAGITADRVINCWSDAQLEAWMEARRS